MNCEQVELIFTFYSKNTIYHNRVINMNAWNGKHYTIWRAFLIDILVYNLQFQSSLKL